MCIITGADYRISTVYTKRRGLGIVLSFASMTLYGKPSRKMTYSDHCFPQSVCVERWGSINDNLQGIVTHLQELSIVDNYHADVLL